MAFNCEVFNCSVAVFFSHSRLRLFTGRAFFSSRDFRAADQSMFCGSGAYVPDLIEGTPEIRSSDFHMGPAILVS